MDLNLQGKRALVSGSNRGTGRVVALRLAAEGVIVCVHGPTAGSAQDVVEEITDAGGTAQGVFGDLTTDEGVAECSRAVGERGVDILVNNFGMATAGRWLESSADVWLDAYQKNVLSGVRLATTFVPAMRARGWGRVLFVGTSGATRPGARTPHYYAAKSALPAVALSLAKELASTGITVNTISPGLLRTPEVEAWLKSRAEKKGWGDDWPMIERRALAEMGDNPTGRLGLPDDVAAAVLFLVSDVASYINATHLRVDGGMHDHVH
jgi:3-oxoacyl-[acyl-carrier protein] reductase